MRALGRPVTVEVGGRNVEIREVCDRLFNVFDEVGRRLAILAPDGDGLWWRVVRVDGLVAGEPRLLHCPGGLEEATRRVLAA